MAARLGELGITVVPQYGVGGYRVDFAASHPDDASRMILAIEADGAGYRDSGGVRDRDRLRKEHLERLGWRVHRLWSTAWFTDPEGELAKLRKAFDSAVRAAPPPPAPEPEPEPPARTGTVDGNAQPFDGNDPLDGTTTPAAPATSPESAPPSGAAPSPEGPRSPEPRQPDAGSWPRDEDSRPRDEDSWPRTADPGRAIPLGPGERRQLGGPAPKALPASAATGRSGPIALPAARDSQDR